MANPNFKKQTTIRTRTELDALAYDIDLYTLIVQADMFAANHPELAEIYGNVRDILVSARKAVKPLINKLDHREVY